MKIERAFTKAGASPYAAIAFRSASSEIRNPDGSVVFAATDLEVPAGWSQVAIDVLAQKYFRKAGVPARLKPVIEKHDILRLKGFADVGGKAMRLQVQAVGNRVDSHFDREWQAGEARRTRLVVIGLEGLNQQAISAELAAALG